MKTILLVLALAISPLAFADTVDSKKEEIAKPKAEATKTVAQPSPEDVSRAAQAAMALGGQGGSKEALELLKSQQKQ